jgi:hypothetical protein
VDFWYADPSGPETSQHVADWSTFTHITHGLLLYLLIWRLAPRIPLAWRFAFALGIEAGWKVIENTALVIRMYRQSALAAGYAGDSVVNSLGDSSAACLGFVLAAVLPVRVSVLLGLASELALGVLIHDNLALNVLQLFRPSATIGHWQNRHLAGPRS